MSQTLSTVRLIVAVVIALLGSVFIWVVVPYNNFLFHNTFLADSFLPEIVVGLLLGLILVLNPLLNLVNRDWLLNRRQLALITSVLLFASIIPSNGLMRMFPRFVASSNQELNGKLQTAKIAADAKFRQSLFPDPLPTLKPDGSVQMNDTPISNQFLDELDPGNSVPWSAWVVPMVAWGGLIVAMWTMMIGLSGVVFPQWRDRERLPFPLLNVYQSLTGSPEDKQEGVFRGVFTAKSFWIAAGVVFLIHAMRGLSIFTQACPSFPLEWNLSSLFTDGIMRYAPQVYRVQYIFFAVVGVAYFIPSRYSISIWGCIIVYGFYLMFGRAYIPAFDDGQANDQSFGVLLSIAVWVLWLGRNHWVQVGRAMLGPSGGHEDSRRDAVAGWMFAIGCAGMICWLFWAGCSLWWSTLATAGCAIFALLMARLIAETGIPVFWLNRLQIVGLSSFFPLAWQSPAILFFQSVFYVLLCRASAMSTSVITTLSLGIDQEAGAKYRSRMALGGLGVLIVGFFICGAVHINMDYHSSQVSTQAKMSASVIEQWARVGNKEETFFTDQRGHQAAGFAVGTVLLWLCARFPAWPLHPVGIVFIPYSPTGNLIWFSVFLGWLIKFFITSLFGGGAYRKAKPLFVGLILGELAAVLVWALVPVVIWWVTGAEPASIPRYNIVQYG